jgi:hypothetical protein
MHFELLKILEESVAEVQTNKKCKISWLNAPLYILQLLLLAWKQELLCAWLAILLCVQTLLKREAYRLQEAQVAAS